MLGLLSVNGVVAAGYTESGYGHCLGWFGCYRDLTQKNENEGITCKIADISSQTSQVWRWTIPLLFVSLAALPICCDPPPFTTSASDWKTPYCHGSSSQTNFVTMATKKEPTTAITQPSFSLFRFSLTYLFWLCFVLLSKPRREDGRLPLMSSWWTLL